MRTVNVPLGDRSYPILIGKGLLPRLGRECKRLGFATTCAIVTDNRVGALYAGAAMESLQGAGFQPVVVTFPHGEKEKNLRNVQACYAQLAAHRIERKSFVVALGGGVVGDLAGFVAASYLRGLPFVQVPTTLLAQVDSSVGGKVGVNLPAGKNLVGSFHQPRLVLCDVDTLDTLEPREYRAGIAEIIKYGIICDTALFKELEEGLPRLLERNPEFLTRVVSRSCEIKAEVVGRDETEGGLRAILNFGHTIGHALEAVSRYGTYLHGEAISIGQVGAARFSADLTGLPLFEVARIDDLFQRAGLPVRVRVTPSLRRRLLEAMALDKKVSGGVPKFVLATRLGKVRFGCQVSPALLRQTLDQLHL